MKLTEKLHAILEGGFPKADWEVQFDKDVASYKFPKEVKPSDKRQFLAVIQKLDKHTKKANDADKLKWARSFYSSVPGYFQPLLLKHIGAK